MRSFARFLIRLYPAAWRKRYGEEFEALLEDSSAGWPAVLDLLKGAIKMQFSVPTFPKLALILSVAGLLIGLLVSSLLTPIYSSQAEMQIALAGSSPPGDNLIFTRHLLRLEQDVLSRASLKAIIQDPRLNLYPEQQTKMPLEDVIQKMRTQDIQIRVDGPPEQGRLALHIAFLYQDRVKAQQTVQALVSGLAEANLHDQRPGAQSAAGQLDQIRRLESRVALLEKRLGIASAAPEPGDQFAVAYTTGINLEVIDPPSLPVRPAKPNRELFMATGFGAGFIAALIVAIFRHRPPPIPFPAQTA